jgi:hypothetical protein
MDALDRFWGMAEMAKLPPSRTGERLQVRKRQIAFSLWPTKKGKRHSAHQSILFSLNPWIIIKQSIESDCPAGSVSEALACLEQSQDFYTIGCGQGVESARPLALYYSYMNLVKAFCLVRGRRATFDRAQHGLSEILGPGGVELTDAFLDAYVSPNHRGALQNYDEFYAAISGAQLPGFHQYKVMNLVPQILSGHRLWSQGAKARERFIAIHDIHVMTDKTTREMWLRIFFFADDLTRLDVTRAEFLRESQLSTYFREVKCDTSIDGRKQICFEQIAATGYPNGFPADSIQSLVDGVRHLLWCTVSTLPPYRRYYTYLSPPAELSDRVPQLLSMYAITYYLGSITRYRPHHFGKILSGAFGPRMQDFVTGQPPQFLYLMASEFAKQDIAKPSIL